MIFKFHESNGYSHFTAIPENEDEYYGYKAEGPYPRIRLVHPTLSLKYVSVVGIHPDIIAAICLTAFYPFIKYKATMPLSVSSEFNTALQTILIQHEMINGSYRATQNIVIRNVDDYVRQYKGDRTVIAFGGGVDSTALSIMFPEYGVVHGKHCDVTNVDNFAKSIQVGSHIVENNCTQICDDGFTTFTNIFLSALVMSSDLEIGNIMCGEILTSSFLTRGIKYFPQINPRRRNRWFRFYEQIGMNIISPVAGCSEIVTAKIVFSKGLSDKVLFCEKNEGHPCYKCTKCFRKCLIFACCGKSYDFGTFDQEYISNYLRQRPLPSAHVFIEVIKSNRRLPSWIHECIDDLKHIKTDLFHKAYGKSFLNFPSQSREFISNRVRYFVDTMTISDELYLENWNMEER